MALKVNPSPSRPRRPLRRGSPWALPWRVWLAQRGRKSSSERYADKWIAAMVPAPDAEQEARLRSLVADLDDGAVWGKFDFLHIQAGHAASPARLNAVEPGRFNLAPVNGPSFVAYKGTSGDGATSYHNIDGFAPALIGTGSRKWQRTSAHLGVWVLNSRSVSNMAAMGGRTDGNTHQNFIQVYQGVGAISTRISQDSAGSQPNSPLLDSAGHFVGSRPDSAHRDVYADGALVRSDNVNASPGETAQVIAEHALRTAGTATVLSSDQHAVTHGGAGLVASDVGTIYDALFKYLTAVAAI